MLEFEEEFCALDYKEEIQAFEKTPCFKKENERNQAIYISLKNFVLLDVHVIQKLLLHSWIVVLNGLDEKKIITVSVIWKNIKTSDLL